MRSVRIAAALVAVLVALKLAVLAADDTVRFYLGDSVAYLAGAESDSWLPRDRSFVYSLVLRGLVAPFAALPVLLWWQAGVGIATAAVLYLLLRQLAVGRRLAAVAAAVLAVEPAQLYYERMVLAESFGLLAFVLFVAAAFRYLAAPRILWLIAVAALGLAAASLRLNYLPVVLVISCGVPLLRGLERVRPRVGHIAAHTGVAVLSVVLMHAAYQLHIAAVFDVPPSYLARSGFMQLGLVTPLIEPDHLASVGLPRDLTDHLAYPLDDRRARLRHMWSAGGLVHEMRRRRLDVERVSRELSRLALRADPLRLLPMGLATVADYFHAESIAHALENDLGHRAIPPEVLYALRERWAYEAADVPWRVTPVIRYFAFGTWWLVACLFVLAPASMLTAAIFWPTPQRSVALLVALVGCGLVAAHVLFVNAAFYRYLHPLPFFVILTTVPAAVQWARRDAARPGIPAVAPVHPLQSRRVEKLP